MFSSKALCDMLQCTTVYDREGGGFGGGEWGRAGEGTWVVVQMGWGTTGVQLGTTAVQVISSFY